MQPIRNIPQASRAYHENRPLTRRQIGGRLTLLGTGPVVIDAVHGTVFEVEYGTLEVNFDHSSDAQKLRSGEAFCAIGNDTVTLNCEIPARVRIAWPPEAPVSRFPVPRLQHVTVAAVSPAARSGFGRTAPRIAAL